MCLHYTYFTSYDIYNKSMKFVLLLHFTDKKIEAQRDRVTYPKAYSSLG